MTANNLDNNCALPQPSKAKVAIPLALFSAAAHGAYLSIIHGFSIVYNMFCLPVSTVANASSNVMLVNLPVNNASEPAARASVPTTMARLSARHRSSSNVLLSSKQSSPVSRVGVGTVLELPQFPVLPLSSVAQGLMALARRTTPLPLIHWGPMVS